MCGGETIRGHIMKRAAFIVFVSMACFAGFASHAAAASKVLKMALGDPASSVMGVVGTAFKKHVEEGSKGAIAVELHFSGELGDEVDTVLSVRDGMLDLTLVGIANVTPYVPEMALLTLPYLFNNIDEIKIATNGAPAELLNSYANKAGFRILAWTYADYRYMSNSLRPVTKLADIQGMKFRVPQSAVLIETYRAFGAKPVAIPWSLVPSMLDKGIVDGQCYGYTGFLSMKFHELNQKYIAETHYTYQLQPLLISNMVFRKLSSDERELLKAAGKKAQEAGAAYEAEEASKAKQKLIDAGVVVTQLEDEGEWKKIALRKVWPKVANLMGGKHTINTFLQACGKPAWRP